MRLKLFEWVRRKTINAYKSGQSGCDMDEVDTFIDSVVVESQQWPGILGLDEHMHFQVNKEDTIKTCSVSYNAPIMGYIISNQSELWNDRARNIRESNGTYIICKKVFYCCSRQILSLSLSYEKFSSLVLFCSRNIFSLRVIDEKSFSYRLRTSSPKTYNSLSS